MLSAVGVGHGELRLFGVTIAVGVGPEESRKLMSRVLILKDLVRNAIVLYAWILPTRW